MGRDSTQLHSLKQAVPMKNVPLTQHKELKHRFKTDICCKRAKEPNIGN
jgi:hypothetical protein